MNHMRPVKQERKIVAVMLAILVSVFALGITAKARACDGVYLKVGASYKTHAQSYALIRGNAYQWKDHSSRIGARFELGAQKGDFTFGAAHYSQWGDGWPVNSDKEAYRTELFVDYKFDLWRF